MSFFRTVLMGIALLCASRGAEAATIELSEHSSDPLVAASDMTATLAFSVSGTDLTLDVTNDSQFEVTEIYFNFSSDVTTLTLDSSPAGWNVDFDQKAAGFGVFDAVLVADTRGRRAPGGIAAGDSASFMLGIVGSGPFSTYDFTSDLSEVKSGTGTHAAAKFKGGAYGATAPEPHAAVLFLVGAALVGAAVRRSSPR